MRDAVPNIPHLLPLTNRESSPIDGGLSVVEGRHGTLARVFLAAAGRRAGPADPDADPVDLLGDPDGHLAGPGDRFGDPDDRSEDRDGRAASVAGPVGVVPGWLQPVHPGGIAGGPAASPDGLLASLGCPADDRDGLLEGPADPGGDPADLVAYLDGLGRDPRSGSPSVHRWDR